MILSIIGASFTMLWGVSHLIPTKNVVRDFGEISEDNKNIVRMEWINEGATLIFLGLLVIVSIVVTGDIVIYINYIVGSMLIILSVISLLTGFKIKFLPFKLCPIIFSVSAILLFISTLI